MTFLGPCLGAFSLLASTEMAPVNWNGARRTTCEVFGIAFHWQGCAARFMPSRWPPLGTRSTPSVT